MSLQHSRKVPAAGGRRGPQVAGVGGAVAVTEDVEEPAAEDGVEGFAGIGQVPGVVAEEPGRAAPLACLVPGGVQRAGGEVGACGVQAEPGGHEGVLAGACGLALLSPA